VKSRVLSQLGEHSTLPAAVIAAGAAFALVVGCSSSTDPSGDNETNATRAGSPRSDSSNASASRNPADSQTAHVSPASKGETALIFLSPNLIQSVACEKGDSQFNLVTRERNPAIPAGVLALARSDAWHEQTESFSATFQLEDIQARLADELYLFGKLDNGEDVVERWHLPAQEGGWVASRADTAGPIGTPAPTGSAPLVEVFAPPYVAPSERGPRAVEIRERVYQGRAFGGTRKAEVDKNGRFLVVLSESNSILYQIVLDGSPDPTPILTPNEMPELAAMGGMANLEHESGSRALVLSPGPDHLGLRIRIVLWDFDNDGEYDAHVLMTNELWESAGLSGPVWANGMYD